jgi:hypothetical protein
MMSTEALGPLDPVSHHLHEPSLAAQASLRPWWRPPISPDAYPPPRLSPPSFSCSGLALGLELPRSAPIIVRLTLTLRAVRDTLTA